jgi:hypothetical protein
MSPNDKIREFAYYTHKKRLLGKLDHELKFLDKGTIQLNEDRAAVVHAVRGASDKTPPADPPVNWATLTDQEFRAEKRKLGLPE